MNNQQLVSAFLHYLDLDEETPLLEMLAIGTKLYDELKR